MIVFKFFVTFTYLTLSSREMERQPSPAGTTQEPSPWVGKARQYTPRSRGNHTSLASSTPTQYTTKQTHTKHQKQSTIEPHKCIYVLPCESTKKTCDYETKVAAKAHRFSIKNDTKQHFVDKSGVTECFNRQCVVEDIVESVFCCILFSLPQRG